MEMLLEQGEGDKGVLVEVRNKETGRGESDENENSSDSPQMRISEKSQ